MVKCPLTGSTNTEIIYEQKGVPLLQNKVYPDEISAINAKLINVTLAQSLENGFVFSADFDESIIDYDQHYQNEQSNSPLFQKHLEEVYSILKKHEMLGKKIVEIGCGKAYFMNILLQKGEDITGFDPTYEGDSPRVIKDFFSDKYSNIGAESIILRHTLEHIPEPFHFIQTVANANKNKGLIYIEVPTFEWIVQNKATEDIFYEHCNYFTLETLQQFFGKSTGGHFFNGQYIYVIGDLSTVKAELPKIAFKKYEIKFDEKLNHYTNLLKTLKNVAIWGAGAKGSTFLNLTDKKRELVKCVIDINPKKQNQYIGGTGHKIIKPEDILNYEIENIIVMNINYLEEIKSMLPNKKINLITLNQ